jgi:hypothetical protein
MIILYECTQCDYPEDMTLIEGISEQDVMDAGGRK